MTAFFARFCFFWCLLIVFPLSAEQEAPKTEESAVAALRRSSVAKAEVLQETSIENLKEEADRVEVISLKEERPDFPPLALLLKKQPTVLGGYAEQKLSYFGADVFSKMQLELSRIPLHQRRVPDEYVLGPGDALSLHVWNQTQDQLVEGEINRNGMLHFPLVGEIRLQGISISRLVPYLKSRLESYYRQIDLSFELTALKQFPVYLTGEVKMPGVQIANCLSTPIQLLMAAGGIKPRGSLRRVRHIRNGKVLRQIDLYDFLLQGSLGDFVFMEPEDVLHVPVADQQVAFVGRVKRPAIYEPAEKEDFERLLSFAGGFEADADQGLLQVISFDGRGEPQISDIDLRKGILPIIKDGTIFIAHASGVELRNNVEISGNVFKPGVFAWSPGLTIADLVKRAQGLKPETAQNRAELLRVALKPHIFNSVPAAPVQVEQLVFIIDLQKELSGVQRTELEKGDILRIFHLSELQIAPQVEIKGEVKKPGKYPLRANQKLSGLLAQAILTGRSHELKGEIARKTDGKTELLPFDVEAVMTGDVSQNLLLQNQDVISIFGEPESARLNSIQLSGEVRFPGTYIFKPQEKLSDLIKRAGGLTEKAWLPGARFFRQRVRRQHEELRRNFVERERRKLGAFKEAAGDVDADKGADRALAVKDLENVEEAMRALESFELNGRINLDLSQMNSVADLTGTESDLLLEDGDAFQVVQKPVEVVVYGQVMSPGTILFRENFSFADYIELVGGYADNANRSKVFILRANGDSLNISTLRRRGSGRRYVRNVRESEEAVTGILPGDTIIVPARIKSSRNHFAETLDSIYKMAISVGALGALF